jgi:hypothetical protein
MHDFPSPAMANKRFCYVAFFLWINFLNTESGKNAALLRKMWRASAQRSSAADGSPLLLSKTDYRCCSWRRPQAIQLAHSVAKAVRGWGELGERV